MRTEECLCRLLCSLLAPLHSAYGAGSRPYANLGSAGLAVPASQVAWEALSQPLTCRRRAIHLDAGALACVQLSRERGRSSCVPLVANRGVGKGALSGNLQRRFDRKCSRSSV